MQGNELSSRICGLQQLISCRRQRNHGLFQNNAPMVKVEQDMKVFKRNGKKKVSNERCYVCKERGHLARKCPLVIREHLAFNDAPGNGDYHAQMVAEESYDAEESVMKVETTKVKDPLAFALGTDSSGTISNNIVFCWWAKEVQY